MILIKVEGCFLAGPTLESIKQKLDDAMENLVDDFIGELLDEVPDEPRFPSNNPALEQIHLLQQRLDNDQYEIVKGVRILQDHKLKL